VREVLGHYLRTERTGDTQKVDVASNRERGQTGHAFRFAVQGRCCQSVVTKLLAIPYPRDRNFPRRPTGPGDEE
jgi:hypothetical protein